MTQVTLWDTTTPADVPRSRQAYAGYVDGGWRSYHELVRRAGPHVPVLSITVTGAVDAHVVDVENGDVSYGGAARWIARQQARGVHRPVVYTSLYAGTVLVPMLETEGHHRSSYRLWLAHWTHQSHICGPECGWHFEPPGMTQWTDRAPRPWHADLSLTTLGWLHAVLHDHARITPGR